MFRDPAYFRALREQVVPRAAHLSVAEDLGGRLQHRRGGLLAGDPAARGRPARAHADLRHRHQPAGAAEGRGRRLRRRPHRRLHREPPASPAARARCPTTTPRPTARACSTSRCSSSIVFSDHSLATDSVFAEVQLVSCRNVLIYFNRELQDRAVGLFRESLCRKGFSGSARRNRCASRRTPTRSPSSSRDERIYPEAGRHDGDRLAARRDRRRRDRHLGRRRRGAVGAAAGAAGRPARRGASSCCTCRASGRACWSRSFSRKCALPVREAQDKEPVEPGTVYFAPPDYHLLVDAGRRLRCRSTSRCTSRGRRSTCCSSPPPTSTASGCSASS